MLDKARSHLVDAEQRAMAIEREARHRADEIVREAELRAREVAAEIIVVARQWVSDVVDRTRAPDSVLFADERGGDVVIDLRTRAEGGGCRSPSTTSSARRPTSSTASWARPSRRPSGVRSASPSVSAGQYRD